MEASAPDQAAMASGDARSSAQPSVWLRSLADIARVVNNHDNLGGLLNRICYAICKHTAWSTSAVLRVDRAAKRSILMARFDPYLTEPPQTSWDFETSPTAVVMRTGKPLIVSHVDQSTEYQSFRDDAIARSYKTLVMLPLSLGDVTDLDLIISVKSRDDIIVDDEHIAFLETVANLAAIAVSKTHRLDAERSRSETMNRIASFHRQLLDTAITAQSMPELIAAAQMMLPFPLAVVDLTRHQPWGHNTPEPTVPDDAWQACLEQNFNAIVQTLAARPGRAGEACPLLIPNDDRTLRLEALVEPIEVEGEKAGYVLFLPGATDIDDLTQLVMQEIKFAVNVHLMRSHIRLRSETKSANLLVSDLLRGNWASAEDIHDQASQLRFDLRKPNKLITIAALESGARFDMHAISSVADTFRQLGFGALVAHADNRLIVLCPASEGLINRQAELLRRLGSRLRAPGAGELILHLGGPCNALTDYAAEAQSGARVVKLARSFGRSGILSEADFGHHAVLLSSIDRTTRSNYVTDQLGRIEAYDEAHGSELLPTLSAFLATGCRYQPTADKLQIHVTTLRYRLERLATLFDVDWSDPEIRFGLELALKFRSYLTS